MVLWEHRVLSHVLLLQDGSIFTKQSSSVVNAKRGEQTHCHAIVEGRFEPVLTTPGVVLVTWTSAAEIEVKAPWSDFTTKLQILGKQIGSAGVVWMWCRQHFRQRRVTWTCSSFATSGLSLSRPTPALSCRALSEKVLSDLGMKPANLWFWCPQAEAT